MRALLPPAVALVFTGAMLAGAWWLWDMLPGLARSYLPAPASAIVASLRWPLAGLALIWGLSLVGPIADRAMRRIERL